MIYSRNKVMKVIGAMLERFALRSVTFYIVRLIEKVPHKKKPENYSKERALLNIEIAFS